MHSAGRLLKRSCLMVLEKPIKNETRLHATQSTRTGEMAVLLKSLLRSTQHSRELFRMENGVNF